MKRTATWMVRAFVLVTGGAVLWAAVQDRTLQPGQPTQGKVWRSDHRNSDRYDWRRCGQCPARAPNVGVPERHDRVGSGSRDGRRSSGRGRLGDNRVDPDRSARDRGRLEAAEQIEPFGWPISFAWYPFRRRGARRARERSRGDRSTRWQQWPARSDPGATPAAHSRQTSREAPLA